jgi:hypothetical protein
MDNTMLFAQSADTLNVITQITYLLVLFLMLAVFIERCTEVFMSVLKYVDLKFGWYQCWNKKATRFRDRLDRFTRMEGSESGDKRLLYRWILWNIVSDEPYTGGKAVVAAKSVRTSYYRFISRSFAFLLSLFLSIWMYHSLGVDLVEILKNVGNYQTPLKVDSMVWLKILVTALLLTAGSEPLHQLIKRVEQRGKLNKNKAL